jgi:hypothetical protein
VVVPRTRSGLLTARRPFAIRRSASFMLQLFLVAAIAAEGGACVAAERFRDSLQSMEGRTLAEKRREYESIRAWGTFDFGLRARVNRPLERRLVGLADTVITDYRRDGPTMSVAEWRQAQEAIKWALALDPSDHKLQARLLMCEAHLARFAARVHRRGSPASREAYTNAIDRFRAAAELDDSSYDPYLGISNIQAYGLDEVDLAADAIEQAEKRGYVAGRRERAQLGDGYLRRGDRIRRRAVSLMGDSRRTELEKARAEYERCAERFEPIRDFGRAGANFDYCRAHRDRITSELEAESATAWVM